MCPARSQMASSLQFTPEKRIGGWKDERESPGPIVEESSRSAQRKRPMHHQPSQPGGSMTNKLDDRALDRLFRTARTRNAWTEQAVTQQQLWELYDLMKFGPTSGNCCLARFVWVRSAEGKSRLAALAAPNNAPKILAAPLTVIVGYDLDFAEQLPKLFPARGKDMQAYYSDPLV